MNKQIEDQYKYIMEVLYSDRDPNRKLEVLESAIDFFAVLVEDEAKIGMITIHEN